MYNYHKHEEAKIEFVEVGPVEEFTQERIFFLEIDDLQIVVFNIGGKYFAIEDRCSHDDGPLGEGDLEDNKIVCPRHGAQFDVRTGAALSLPAVVDIPAYPIRLVEGQLEIGLPSG